MATATAAATRSLLTHAMQAPRPTLPDVERLSSRVIRILGGNPGKFTLQGTNTYLIGRGPSRILIDTGEGKPAWATTLASVLASENASLEAVIVTHWHPDHVGGIADARWISPGTTVYKNQPREGEEDIADGQRFTVDGATLRAFHSPGHTTDHMALVLEEEDAMFTGDNVLGHGTSVFEDLATYVDSLRRMGQAVGGRGYPGHGPVIEDCRAKIGEYIRHREMREKEVLEVLGRGAEGEALTSMDLVHIIYQDVPENLHFAAARGVVQVLGKLTAEGKLYHDEDAMTWCLNRKSTL
ncbi:metallo-beta-lactamase domain-containing protein [Trichodelitschia bisporula]|uniref:Metallo-beta-lactamase domain-containing protein n=1 Tax=Trichodelitschia bisporula TaxID=703511 RepID=A0A6G1HVJ3_9PEZI|nr:metallo-beta-lactamase domain-containing protein [Trichodelitschia bisporula]